MDKISVIYDDNCEFCRWSIKWLKEQDRNFVLRFIPCQSEERKKEFPQIEESRCLSALQVILLDQSVHSGFDGIASIMRFLPRLKFLGFILSFPFIKILGRYVYRWIAKNRYRIKCSDGSCHL